MKRKIYREDIIIAGRDLMFSQGYFATGIKDITDHLKIPKGSFYNHFNSKEEFGIEVVKYYADNGTKIHEDYLVKGTESPLNRLKNFYSETIKTMQNVFEYKLGCIMSNFSAEMADINENFREVLDEGFKGQEAAIAQCLKEAQERGEIKAELDCEQTGSFVINSWHGALVRMKATQSVKPLNDFYTSIFQYLAI